MVISYKEKNDKGKTASKTNAVFYINYVKIYCIAGSYGVV